MTYYFLSRGYSPLTMPEMHSQPSGVEALVSQAENEDSQVLQQRRAYVFSMIYTYMHKCIYENMYVYIYICVYMYMYVCIYIYTHTLYMYLFGWAIRFCVRYTVCALW